MSEANLTEDEWLEIKSAIVHDYTVCDLNAKVESLELDKRVLEKRIEELEKKLEETDAERESYKTKYIDESNKLTQLVMEKGRLVADRNNLFYRLQKYEGSPPEE